MIAVFQQAAKVFAGIQHIAGVFGFHRNGAAKPAVAVQQVVRAFIDVNALEQLRFDEHRALAVFLEPFGRAVQHHVDIFHIAHPPDVQTLSAGTRGAGHRDAGQAVEQAGDVIGLHARDVFLIQGRAAGGDAIA